MARLANRYGPELRSHDRFGNRIDEIAFHPAWHALMARAIGQETHALAWNKPGPGAQVARAGLQYLWYGCERHLLPISMTYSAIPVLRQDRARWAEWGGLISSKSYDGRQGPAQAKTGATVGMAMTETQGARICADEPSPMTIATAPIRCMAANGSSRCRIPTSS